MGIPGTDGSGAVVVLFRFLQTLVKLVWLMFQVCSGARREVPIDVRFTAPFYACAAVDLPTTSQDDKVECYT